ncbi:MAG: WG repeat-containing protein [Lentisphaeria bacterium]|nr:WG repeat-containing protein [Lentisphaeria bacterium]
MKKTAFLLFLLASQFLFGEELYPYRRTPFFGKTTWGLCDARGKVVTPPVYAGITLPSGGVAVGLREDGTQVLLKDGKECGPFPFDAVGEPSENCIFRKQTFSEGLTAVKREGKWGFADTSLKIVIPCAYDLADDFSCGLARVRKNGQWGYIDRNGRLVHDFRYEKAFDFQNGCAQAVLRGKWGAVDTAGKEVLPFKYEGVGRFSHGMFHVSTGGRVRFFVDRRGERAFPGEFSFARDFSRGVAAVSGKNGKAGVIDVKGNTVIPFAFDGLSDFSGRFYAYRKDSRDGARFGFIDRTGKRLTPPVFTMADPIAEDIFLVARKYKKYRGSFSTVFTPVDYVFLRIAPDGRLTFFEN